MKKKIVLGLAVALSLVCLAGCGGEKKTINGDVQTPGQTQESKETESQQANRKGYVFKSGSAVIDIDGDMAPVAEALGEPVSYFEAASCAFEGLDKTYTYAGFVVETYPKNDKDLVSSIVIKDDSVKTPEGVTVGSTRDEMIAAYGENYAEEAGMLVYAKDGMKLMFLLKNDMVSSIQYTSTVLSE